MIDICLTAVKTNKETNKQLTKTLCLFSSPPPVMIFFLRDGVGEILESRCPCVRSLSGRYLLSRWTFCNQTWYGGMVLSWTGVSCEKIWCAIFKIKVTARAYIINLWLFLRYLLKFRSVCNQTWFDGTSPLTRVSCEKLDCCVQGQGHSKGSKCRRTIVRMIFSEPRNILSPNLVGCCIVMSWSVIRKNWYAIFKVKLTARAHMIQIWLFVLYPLNCWSFFKQTWFYGLLL